MKKIIVALIVVITVISSFVFAEGVEANLLDASNGNVYRGISEAVSMLEDGSLVARDNTEAPLTTEIKVQLNGAYINFTDSEGNVSNPKILNNRTMVPMRKIFETLNAQVSWDEATRTVKATTSNKEITLVINNAVAKVKDLATGVESSMTLDQAPVVSENRTLVPVRFIAESLDKEVGWDNATRTVIIIDMKDLTNYLSQTVPALQKLFDMNIEPVQAFKAASKISGSLAYTAEGENQAVTIDGNAEIAVNKAEEMESSIKLAVTGTAGELADAVKDGNYDRVDAKVILKGDKLYVGLLEGNDYKWTDASTAVGSVNNVSVAYNVDKMGDYASVMQFIRTAMGELSVNSYSTMKSIVDSLGYLLSDSSVKLVESGSKKTLTLDLDFGKFAKEFIGGDSNFDIKLNVVLVAENGKIAEENIKVDAKFEVSGEEMLLNFLINSTYSDLNQDFVVTAPTL